MAALTGRLRLHLKFSGPAACGALTRQSTTLSCTHCIVAQLLLVRDLGVMIFNHAALTLLKDATKLMIFCASPTLNISKHQVDATLIIMYHVTHPHEMSCSAAPAAGGIGGPPWLR